MKIKAYHATTPEAAERILVEGFKIPKESEEFYQGRGVYFAAGQEALDIVKRHGRVVLEVEPTRLKSPEVRVRGYRRRV